MEIETNKLKRAWIWLWYSDTTRLCVIMGLPTILFTILIGVVFGPGDHMRIAATSHYMVMFVWMLADNDYSNLRRIGLDEHRNKIKAVKK